MTPHDFARDILAPVVAGFVAGWHTPIPPWARWIVRRALLLRGALPTMATTFHTIATAGVVALAESVTIAELELADGTPEEKKAKVVAELQGKVPAIADGLGLAPGLAGILSNAFILGMAYDAAVRIWGAMRAPKPAA